MILRTVKRTLDLLMFALTIFLVLYGLYKGFNVIELTSNLLYFSALLIKQIIDIWESSKRWKSSLH
ncbi:MAG: hypothetical protein Q7K45_04680 [Nanoarchaeota archaeon]|nr:hypothetical protein [Nanoarchaeota archaeon]